MEWKTIIGYQRPENIEIGKTTVYLRRNIEEVKDNENNDCYSYDECQMSHIEYEKYIESVSSVEFNTMMEFFKRQEDEQAALLLTQVEIQETMKKQDDVLAEILINQMEESHE